MLHSNNRCLYTCVSVESALTLTMPTIEPVGVLVRAKVTAIRKPMAIEAIIIRGITKNGRNFRPSDWAERLYYAVASYGPNREVSFNPLVTLTVNDKDKCVVIDIRLRDEDSMVFDFLTGFAEDNELVVLDQDRVPVANI